MDMEGNYAQCCMSEGSCTLSVCSIKLNEFVLTLDGAYETQDFEHVGKFSSSLQTNRDISIHIYAFIYLFGCGEEWSF